MSPFMNTAQIEFPNIGVDPNSKTLLEQYTIVFLCDQISTPPKKKCLVDLHHPPLIFENWKKKDFTIQTYATPDFRNTNFISLRIFIF